MASSNDQPSTEGPGSNYPPRPKAASSHCEICRQRFDACGDCTGAELARLRAENERQKEELNDIRAQAEDATEYVLAQINADLRATIERKDRALREGVGMDPQIRMDYAKLLRDLAARNNGNPVVAGPFTLEQAAGEIDRLRAENERLEAWEKAANEGHPSPCTLGPLCPYCEIDRQRAAIERKDRALEKAQEALRFYSGAWHEDEGTLTKRGRIEPGPSLWSDKGDTARSALAAIDSALGNVRNENG